MALNQKPLFDLNHATVGSPPVQPLQPHPIQPTSRLSSRSQSQALEQIPTIQYSSHYPLLPINILCTVSKALCNTQSLILYPPYHPVFQALFCIQIFIQDLMHFPVLNAEAIFKLNPVSKPSFHINLIQNITCYPKYHPISTASNLNTECNISSSIQIPNYYPKTGALSSIPSIIHYPTIQHPGYYP